MEGKTMEECIEEKRKKRKIDRIRRMIKNGEREKEDEDDNRDVEREG